VINNHPIVFLIGNGILPFFALVETESEKQKPSKSQ